MDEAGAPTVWITGLPGSGKTTLAQAVCAKLKELGCRVEVLDGDELRKAISSDLGFSKEDRRLHARRVTHLCSLLTRNGVVSVVAMISPYREFRAKARARLGRFVEVYARCSLETCRAREDKGLYEMAEKGLIRNVTGIDDPFEEPLEPEIIVNTESQTSEEGADRVIARMMELGFLSRPVSKEVHRATTTITQK